MLSKGLWLVSQSVPGPQTSAHPVLTWFFNSFRLPATALQPIHPRRSDHPTTSAILANPRNLEDEGPDDLLVPHLREAKVYVSYSTGHRARRRARKGSDTIWGIWGIWGISLQRINIL